MNTLSNLNARLYVGISGWRYAAWRGMFYPQDLPQRAELEYAAQRLPSLEINGSFYSLQRPSSYARWYAQTPPGFVFAVKGPRFITHMLRLRGVTAALGNFYASGVLALREKLGPLLWQFPARQAYDAALFEAFFADLPRNTEAAAALAHGHDHRLARLGEPPLLVADRKRPLHHAIEVRHPSFACEDFIALARRHRVALVVADSAGHYPCVEDVTADFVYLRLHGDKELYASGYDNATLARWAERIRAWAAGGQPADARCASSRPPPRRAARDVYCYFDNDAKVHAPADAQALLGILGLRWGAVEGNRAKAAGRP